MAKKRKRKPQNPELPMADPFARPGNPSHAQQSAPHDAPTGAPLPAPIIATLQLDALSQAFFERQRQNHFPPSLNRVPAHLTLFHQLPGSDVDGVLAAVGNATEVRPFRVAVTGLRSLGRGVAYDVASADLMVLRAAIAKAFVGRLKGQDRERFRPHITVQNKVSAHQARQTLAALTRAFLPFDATAEGVQLWRYEGGPWSPLAVTPLRGDRP
ncbi:MAG: 2'-5' RNA ligase family protein [Pseudomonadota bacterium]